MLHRVRLKNKLGHFGAQPQLTDRLPTQYWTNHHTTYSYPSKMVQILHRGASTTHFYDDHIKADVCMLMHMCVCDRTMIILVIRNRMVLHPFMANTETFLLGLFHSQRVFQYDPRAYTSKTSHKTKHLNPFQGVHCYQYHNKRSGLTHTSMPFFL